MAWRSSSVAFLLVPLPPFSWFMVSPSVPGVFSSFRGLFILLPLGFWPQCNVCYSGGGGGGRWARGGNVAGLRVGRPVGVLPPWGVIAVAVPWPMGTQPPRATRALNSVYHICEFLSERIVPLYIILCVLWLWDDTSTVAGEGVLPIAYTGRFRPKEVPFSRLHI